MKYLLIVLTLTFYLNTEALADLVLRSSHSTQYSLIRDTFPLNTWRVIDGASVGQRSHFSLTYLPVTDEYFFNQGTYAQKESHPYPEMMFDPEKEKWINYMPDSQYGVWADSTGHTLVRNVFNGYYFKFVESEGQLIPQLIHNRQAATHRQEALNTIDNKIYYYQHRMTFSYDPQLKKYEIYETDIHPSMMGGDGGALKWGVMSYDPINDEMLLLGGLGIDTEDGHAGSWSFRMEDHQWYQNSIDGIPPARCYGNMVYDPSQEKMLLFGGDHLDYMLSDTWEYDCNTKIWSQLYPELSPRPRGGHLMLYSTQSQKVFLMGGFHNTSNTDYQGPMYWRLPSVELWTYDWQNESWGLVMSFDNEEMTTPRAIAHAPHYLVGAVNEKDQLVVLADGSSRWSYNPKTYFIDLDLQEIDSVATLTNGVIQQTIEQRAGPYAPEYFEDGSADLETGFYEQMPLDTWIKVPIGGDKYPGANRDWGTSVFDPDRNLIYKWAGGHSAHCGNDVPVFNAETAHWGLGYYPSFPLEYIYSGGPNPGYVSYNNRPFLGTHSYDSYDYDVNLGRMVAMSRRYTRLFNGETWDWDTTKILNPQIPLSGYHMSITSTDHGALFWTTRLNGNNNTSRIFLLNSDLMQWDEILYDGPAIGSSYCDKSGATYDSSRDRMLFATFKGDSTLLVAYNFTDNTTESLAPLNYELSGVSELLRESVYIPSLDIVMYQIELDETHKLIYDCKLNSWDSLMVVNGPSWGIKTNTRSSGYMYDAKRNIIFDCEARCQVYALRLSGSFPDTIVINSLDSDLVEVSPINVFPNPSTGLFSIKSDGVQIKNVTIYDNSGRSILSNSNFRTIDLSNQVKGLYFVEIETVDKMKIVKELLVE